MNKTELVAKIAEKTKNPKSKVKEIVDALFDEIQGVLAGGGKVDIIGFGSFFVRDVKERKGKNPKTGEEIVIPSGKRPAFKPGKRLKEAVN